MAQAFQESEARPIDAAGGEALFRGTAERFRRLLAADRQKAFDQFGWTLFHSLPEEQKTRLRQEFGMAAREDARTRYNRGVLAAADGEWAGAIKEFQAALNQDPALRPALHNLALATERGGDLKKARALFERYLKEAAGDADCAEDLDRVKAHLQELAGQ